MKYPNKRFRILILFLLYLLRAGKGEKSRFDVKFELEFEQIVKFVSVVPIAKSRKLRKRLLKLMY